MSTISTAPAAAQSMARQSWGRRLGATLKRWWVARMARRLENLALSQLHAMSDRQLKDIGLGRSEIVGAVRRVAATQMVRERPPSGVA